jgi:hypothetical protein
MFSGLPADPDRAMGAYAMQGRKAGGRPTYKGGCDDNKWVWYHADQEIWIVGIASEIGTAVGSMFVKDSAATPDAVQGTWMVGEGFKLNKRATVTQIAGSSILLPRNRTTDLGCCLAGGTGIRISGLPSSHDSAFILGDYTKQPQTEGGRPTYKRGTRGNMAVWYSAKHEGMWLVGPTRAIGKCDGIMYAQVASAATPDAVPAGKWKTSNGFQPNAAVKCTRS